MTIWRSNKVIKCNYLEEPLFQICAFIRVNRLQYQHDVANVVEALLRLLVLEIERFREVGRVDLKEFCHHFDAAAQFKGVALSEIAGKKADIRL